MYKLMIVEDEPLIRIGLKQYFNWSELGVQTIVEAENGQEGISVALREQPDLVITDIRMPEIDGLEMIEQLRAKLPHTLFIILTGYSEFGYAQRAIQSGGVFEYLLKPLQYEESLKTIKACIAVLENRDKELQALSRLESESQENLKYKASQIVKQIVEEDAQLDEALIHSLFEHNYAAHTYLTIVAAYISKFSDVRMSVSQRRPAIENAVEQVIRAALQPDSSFQTFTYYSKSKMYAITICDKADFFQMDDMQITTINTQLADTIAEKGDLLYMTLGCPTDDYSKLGAIIRMLDRDLYQRFYVPGPLYQSLTVPQRRGTEALIQLEDMDKQMLLACLENGSADLTKQSMRLLAQKAAKGTPDMLLVYLQEVISVTLRFANKHHIQTEGVYNDRLFNLSFVDDFQTIESLFDWIGTWIVHLNSIYLQAGNTKDEPQDDQLFAKIEDFIVAHIDQDVTLQIVADRFFYNPSYLSRLFKSKLNQNYTAFVTDIRIRHAQRSLEQPHYSIADICMMCGYKSYKHFVKTFKSVTRMTPTEYRKQLGIQGYV